MTRNILTFKFLIELIDSGEATYQLISTLDENQIKILENFCVQGFVKAGQLTLEQVVTLNQRTVDPVLSSLDTALNFLSIYIFSDTFNFFKIDISSVLTRNTSRKNL